MTFGKIINCIIIKWKQLFFKKAWLTNCFLCVTSNSLKLLSFDSLLGRSTNYSRYSPEQKAEIGRYAASTNILSAVRKYQADFPNPHKQAVLEFKKAYLKQKESSGKKATIVKVKKRGHPKLTPEEIMKKVIQTIKALRLKGAPHQLQCN